MSSHRLHISNKRRREVFREKFILIMIAAIAAVCCSIILSAGLVDAHDSDKNSLADYKYYKSIEVELGDTLWDIASEYTDGDYSAVQSYVKELKEINGLSSDDIHEGQYLTVSYYDDVTI